MKTLNRKPITTTAAGIPTYRTRQPLTEARAASFARLLNANPRFLQATVVKSRKANHFHVCFLPNSADRITALLDAVDAKDREAQARDGNRFVYRPVARPVELRGYSDVYACEGITGNYETTLTCGGACTCPHYRYRRASSGGRCKHIIELEERKTAGLLSSYEPAPEVAAAAGYAPEPATAWERRAARVSADFD